jgi:hypothetical protein
VVEELSAQGTYKALGAENPVASCDLRIFVDQAAEPIPAQDPDVRAQGGLIAPGRRLLLQRPVRPVRVVATRGRTW